MYLQKYIYYGFFGKTMKEFSAQKPGACQTVCGTQGVGDMGVPGLGVSGISGQNLLIPVQTRTSS